MRERKTIVTLKIHARQYAERIVKMDGTRKGPGFSGVQKPEFTESFEGVYG